MTERTGTVIVIHVPWVPPVESNPNYSRRSERTKVRLRRQGAKDAKYPIIGARQRFEEGGAIFDGPVTLDIDVKWPKGRNTWDGDNLEVCYKYVRDQLQYQGIVSNDRNIRIGEIRQSITDGQEETVLTITEIMNR